MNLFVLLFAKANKPAEKSFALANKPAENLFAKANRFRTLVVILTSLMWLAAGLSLSGALGAFPNLGAGDIRPPTTGDGAAGDSYAARVAICDGELIVAATGDQVPIPGGGQPDGSLYRYRIGVGTEPPLTLIGKIALLGTEQSALFGLSLACDAKELFVGAPGVGTTAFASDAGTVYRYRRIAASREWQFNGEVPGARPAGDARFGYSMALNAGWLVVGAPGEAAAYLYARNAASLSVPQRLSPPDLDSASNFGLEVALGVAELAVAAPSAAQGAVLRYTLETPAVETARLSGASSFGTGLAFVGAQLWIGTPNMFAGVGQVELFDALGVRVQKLAAPSSGGAVEYFGEHIVVNGGVDVAISAVGARLGSADAEGAVHLYRQSARGSWQRSLTVRPDNVQNTGRADAFGNGLALGTEGLFVGAPYADAGGHPSQGKLYAFDANGQARGSVDSGRGAAFDRFGQALSAQQTSANGDELAVGAFLVDSTVGIETGAVYLYRRARSGWVLDTTLTPPDAVEEQRFGVSVDISGDLLVVGSYWDVVGTLVDAGSAYVFQRVAGRWQFLQKLIAPTPRERALFGFAVAIDGDQIAVGARGDSEIFSDQGSVVFYRRNAAGIFDAGPILRPADSGQSDSFGAALDLSGGRALVSAPGSARVYLMQRDGAGLWQFSQTLTDPNAGSADGFGLSLAFGSAPTRAYIGAPFARKPTVAALGRVLEFRPDTAPAAPWTLVRSVESPLQVQGTQFGTSVVAHPDGLVAGAIGIDAGPLADIGGAYLVTHAGVETLLTAPANARANFGRAAAVAGRRALLGAPGTATVNPLEGAVFEALGELEFGDGFE
jgi:hypothetical protein